MSRARNSAHLRNYPSHDYLGSKMGSTRHVFLDFLVIFPTAFILVQPLSAEAFPIECAELDKLLPTKTWYNARSGNNHVFTASSEWKGQRKIGGHYVAKYQLSFRFISKEKDNDYRKEVCLISFTFLNGDCVGDVHTYYAETIGDGLRFKQTFEDGESIYATARRESHTASCTADEYLILPR